MTKNILPEDQQVLETNNKELLCQNRCKYAFQDLANIQRQKEDNEVEQWYIIENRDWVNISDKLEEVYNKLLE